MYSCLFFLCLQRGRKRVFIILNHTVHKKQKYPCHNIGHRKKLKIHIDQLLYHPDRQISEGDGHQYGRMFRQWYFLFRRGIGNHRKHDAKIPKQIDRIQNM